MKNKNKKESIIFGLKDLLKKKLNIAAEGNISVRNHKGFYISPSAFTPDELKETNIAFVSEKGEKIGLNKPSSEWKMHHLIYKNRKEINAIVHCHSIWASCVSCLRKNIPSFHYMISEFGGDDIKCSRYAIFGSEKLAQNVLLSLKRRKGCLLANHGQITISGSLDEALHLAESLEKLSKQFFLCNLTNNIKFLDKKQMNEVIDLFSDYKSIR